MCIRDRVQARKAIREANEDLADLMEVYDAKDKEGLTLWNNATARLKEYKQNMVRLEKARKKPYFGRIDFLAEEKQQKEAYYICLLYTSMENFTLQMML